jgi:hypothetical protein
MRSYRQAALCLHGLAPDDRRWLLNRLPDRHRAMLRDLLAELESLGIPADGGARDLSLAANDTYAADLLEIEGATSEQVWSILEGECDAVVRIVLAVRDWSWKTETVTRLRKNYRNIAASERAPGTRVQEALVKAFARRLRGQQPAIAETSWNKRLRSRLWQR